MGRERIELSASAVSCRITLCQSGVLTRLDDRPAELPAGKLQFLSLLNRMGECFYGSARSTDIVGLTSRASARRIRVIIPSRSPSRLHLCPALLGEPYPDILSSRDARCYRSVEVAVENGTAPSVPSKDPAGIFDGNGNFSGAATVVVRAPSSSSPQIVCTYTQSGTYTVAADGTATMNFTLMPTSSGGCGGATGTMSSRCASPTNGPASGADPESRS